MQVGARKCRHDAGERHLSLALRTGRTFSGPERNDGRQQLRLGHQASFEQASVQHSRSPRQYAVPAIGSLFKIAQSPKISLFLAICFPRKKDRAAFAGGPSQGGNALGKGSDSGGWGSYRVFYFANPKTPRIDEAQFSAHVSRFCVAIVRIAADHAGGTRTPCSRRNAPATLIASATKRSRVSASASPSTAAILRSNTIDVWLATSAQVNVRARNGVMFRFPFFRQKIAQFAAVRGR